MSVGSWPQGIGLYAFHLDPPFTYITITYSLEYFLIILIIEIHFLYKIII